MINISELEQYFPLVNAPIRVGVHTFTISINQNDVEGSFNINLKIKQDDSKIGHLIKFRLGMGKHLYKNNSVHETDKPHFEIDIYKRDEDSFSAMVYFTFDDISSSQLMSYAKGTVVLIDGLIENFIKNYGLDSSLLNTLIYSAAVKGELAGEEDDLLLALHKCYLNSQLIVRDGNNSVIIKTPHNFKKYLGVKDLEPLYLPLLRLIDE